MKIIICIIFLCCGLYVWAESDTATEKRYVIFNAYSKFSSVCIQDDKGSGLNTDYIYSFVTYDSTQLRQQWTFVQDTNDSTLFYIRNVGTKVYLSANPIMASNSYFFKVGSQILKSNALPWKVTPISNTGQVELSCEDSYGVRYYLHATDTTATAATYRGNTLLSKNTRFGWRIVPVESIANAAYIGGTNVQKVEIYVENGHIRVTGTKEFVIFDLSGKVVNPKLTLTPGIYMVKVDGETRKIVVQ